METHIPGRWYWSAAAGLIAFFLLLTLTESGQKSPSSDEPPHLAAGLSYWVTHEIFRANPQHPPLLKELSALSMMAAGIRWPHTPEAQFIERARDPHARAPGLIWKVGNDLIRADGPDRVMFWARLPMIMVGALLVALVFAWGRQLFGPLPALCAALVCVLDPTVLAHAQFVTTDVGVAAFLVLALMALWNYLRKPGWGRLVLCGLSVGLSLSAKYSGLIVLPIFGLLMLATLGWPARSTKDEAVRSQDRNRGNKAFAKKAGRGPSAPGGQEPGLMRTITKAAGALIVICLVAFLVVQATFFFPRDLLTYEKCAGQVNADHVPSYRTFMAGDAQKHFDSYFAVAYLLKEPLSGIALAAVGLAALLRSKTVPVLDKVFVVLPPALFFVMTTMLADNFGVRYIIPVLPFSFLLAGLGMATLIRMPWRWGRPTAGFLSAWMVVAALGIYPDHLSYFNEAACFPGHIGQIGLDGGSRCGTAWLDDSNVDWGQGLKQLKTWLDRNAPDRTVRLATIFGFPPDAYGIRYQPLVGEDNFMRLPGPGLYAVSGHMVARANYYGGWLKDSKPRAVVGHAFYIFDIPGK